MRSTVLTGSLPCWETRLLGLVTAVLVVFGIAAVYGASSIVAVQNGEAGATYALRQLIGAVLGVAGMIVASRIDYRVWGRQHCAWLLIGISSLLLLVLLLPFAGPVVMEINGARRWLGVRGFAFQPSEFAKLAIVVWTAMLATKKGVQVRDFKRGVGPFILIIGPMAALILFEPDLSTALLACFIAGIILFTAGGRVGHFLLLGLIALPIVWSEITAAQYRLQRMLTFLGPGTDLREANWQVQQSIIGMGAGRLLGVGFGEGLQKLGYLPYAYSDFVFSTIGEEWGFVGVLVIISLLATFIGIALRISRTAPDRFGTLLGTGLTALIGVTAVLHMAVTLGIVPTTGLPLPFISYGRSNLVVSLFAAGILINIGEQGARARRP